MSGGPGVQGRDAELTGFPGRRRATAICVCVLTWGPLTWPSVRSGGPLTALPHAPCSAKGGKKGGLRGMLSEPRPRPVHPAVSWRGWGEGQREVLSHLSWGEGRGVWEEVPDSRGI